MAMADVCSLCDAQGLPELDLCHACHNGLPHNHFSCYQCAAPYDSAQNNALICGRCLNRPTGIDHAIVPFLYRPPIDHMIKRLKFSEQIEFSRLLGELLADAIYHAYFAQGEINNPIRAERFPDLILPVPTHPDRLLQRGFNQAEQIANTVAARFRTTCITSAIVRSTSSLPQSTLSAKQREANIRRSFEVKNSKMITKMHVAVVDDVYTTGATARAITRKLKSAGAEKVSIWAVARTP